MNRSKPTAHRAHEMSGEILMVDRKQAAAIAAVSIATWDRMNAGGKTPEPIHLSRGRSWLSGQEVIFSIETGRDLLKLRSTF